MNNLLVWSAVGNAPFVALEPWTGLASCSDEDGIFEHKRGMTVLAPNEIASFKFKNYNDLIYYIYSVNNIIIKYQMVML